MIGRTISHYRIVEKLGEGGMGVVYKAQDLRLDRPVALKFLAEHLMRDQEGHDRFVREAKAAAALDHPNICTVYEIDEADGKTFIAMAFVDGEALNDVISKGPLKIEDAVDLTLQAAAGLGAAHEKGVVHRDVKPANIYITRAGSNRPSQAKVMDFGLAQLAGSSRITKVESTIGTIAYMSPEQTHGDLVDHRSDIWSLGVVLYEMLAGRLPFKGHYDQAILYSVLNEQPDPLTSLRPEIPEALERIVSKALVKDPAARYQTMAELSADLRAFQKAGEPGTAIPVAAASRPGRHLWYLAAAVASVAVVTLVLIWPRSPSPATESSAALQPVPLTSERGNELHVTFSPDGTQVAYSWNGPGQDNYDIYVQVVGSGSPLRLTTDPGDDLGPVWSPDGSQLAFVRATATSAPGVYLVPPLGGRERRVLENVLVPTNTLEWGPQGKSLLFAELAPGTDRGAIFQFFLESGEKRRISSPPETAISGDSAPALSPDGKTLAFTRGNYARRDIYLAPLGGGEPRVLAAQEGMTFSLAWTPDGREIVYAWTPYLGATQSLWKIAAAGGESQRLPTGPGAGNPAVSSRGNRLAYESVSTDTNIWRYWLPRQGEAARAPERVLSSTWLDSEGHISPDGTRIAFSSTRSGAREIWTCDRDGGNLLRLTSLGRSCGSARWSPDGRYIAFDSDVKGNWDIFIVSADGGSPRALTEDPGEDSRPSWSHDNRWVYFGSFRSGSFQIWKTPPEGGEAVQVTENGGYNPVESPDGRFLYFASGANGREIHKRALERGQGTRVLPDFQHAGRNGLWDVTDDGIYYPGMRQNSAAVVWVLKFLRFDTGEISEVMEVPPPTGGPSIDISPDGQWLLYSQTDEVGSDLMLVENFH
jgi:Tol biopolymer transport system component/tRNA A-37 threonylcarbamoyl transferase component Bud32